MARQRNTLPAESARLKRIKFVSSASGLYFTGNKNDGKITDNKVKCNDGVSIETRGDIDLLL